MNKFSLPVTGGREFIHFNYRFYFVTVCMHDIFLTMWTQNSTSDN